MTTKSNNVCVVRGWNQPVEKAEETVRAIMVLNKLWIPDVLIDIIKDYLYINKYDVLRKFYKNSINMSIRQLELSTDYNLDESGHFVYAHWAIGHYVREDDTFNGVQLQGLTCMTCGNPDTFCGCGYFEQTFAQAWGVE